MNISGGSSDARIVRVMKFITSDLARRVSRAEAAHLVNLEPGYFSKRFRKVAGLSFVAWNARIRTVAAKQLLATTRLKIAAIAFQVGYDDLTTLERNLRKHAGVCPRTYRSSIHEGATQNADIKTQNAETYRPVGR